MITWKKYKSKNEAFWMGKKVKTLVRMENGWCEIAEGTICKITRKYKGFSLKSDACEKCGVRVSISRVFPTDLCLVIEE